MGKFCKKVDSNKKSRSSQHTHYECDDNSGYLVSRIRIRCSVACLFTDKQAGIVAAFLQPISLVHEDQVRVSIRRLQRYLLWCILTATTEPHFAHLILMIPSAPLSMSNRRWLQQGHFTFTAPSFSFVAPTCDTSFSCKFQ